MARQSSSILRSLKTFKELSSDEKNHNDMIKEKKGILFAATLLDDQNFTILGLCFDILENLVANEKTHTFLLSTFGIYEALEAISIRMRNVDEKLYRRATEITDILRNSAPPAYNTRSRVKGTRTQKKHQLFLLFIEHLNEDSVTDLEQALLKIKGIISFLVDLELNRCTVRICSKCTIKEVIEKIFMKTSLKALVITKNKEKGIEVLSKLVPTE